MESSTWSAPGSDLSVRRTLGLSRSPRPNPEISAPGCSAHGEPLLPPAAGLPRSPGPAHLGPPGRTRPGAESAQLPGPGPVPLAAGTTTPGLPPPPPAAPHTQRKRTLTSLKFLHSSLRPHFPSHTSCLPLSPSLSLGRQATAQLPTLDPAQALSFLPQVATVMRRSQEEPEEAGSRGSRRAPRTRKLPERPRVAMVMRSQGDESQGAGSGGGLRAPWIWRRRSGFLHPGTGTLVSR